MSVPALDRDMWFYLVEDDLDIFSMIVLGEFVFELMCANAAIFLDLPDADLQPVFAHQDIAAIQTLYAA
jgi:hypothetical protein